MIQLQISIHMPADGSMGHVDLNRLEREDANEAEGTCADVFEAQYTELVKFIAEAMAAQGLQTTYTEIKGPSQ